MSRLGDATHILIHGTESFMSKKDNEMPTTYKKDTDNYRHEDIDGVDKKDLDLNTFKTVCLPNGNKLVTCKNKKTGETVGVRVLIKKGNRPGSL